MIDDLRTLHLAPCSARARAELITRALPELAARVDARAWWFIDVDEVLEFAFLPGRASELREPLARWCRDARARDLIREAALGERAVLLRPELYPGGRVPSGLQGALAHGSARAVASWRDARRRGLAAPTDAHARDELALAHAAFSPALDDRREAVSFHRTWLIEHLNLEAEAPSARARRAEPRAPADYEAIGRALRASAGEGAPGDAAAAVIARLVHVHALRLAPRSPCPEQAHLELRALTELASSLGAT